MTYNEIYENSDIISHIFNLLVTLKHNKYKFDVIFTVHHR